MTDDHTLTAREIYEAVKDGDSGFKNTRYETSADIADRTYEALCRDALSYEMRTNKDDGAEEIVTSIFEMLLKENGLL